jgi:mono/diheme cytochrome c family protein
MLPRDFFFLLPAQPALACPMPCTTFRSLLSLSFLLVFLVPVAAQSQSNEKSLASGTPELALRPTRTSPLDLELAGDLAGMPAGETRYLTREDLLSLPQVTFNVSDDPNFKGSAQISGVLLEELIAHLSVNPHSEMVIAICSDLYRSNYPRWYRLAHRPLLVLLINGQPPSSWPKDAEGHGAEMGPFLISQPEFSPHFHVLSYADEPQIPWGVIRLEFRDEQKVLATIAPRGPDAGSASLLDGFRIAQQNCFRCHNQGGEGGQKAGRSWQVLSTWATASPEYFAAYVHDPKSKNPHSQMPGFPNYDQATLFALISYFRTFAIQEKP